MFIEHTQTEARDLGPVTPDRATGIGASEVAVALGLHPTRTPASLWLLKTGRADYAGRPIDRAAVPVDADPDDDGTPEMQWGRSMEPVILDWYAREFGVEYSAQFDGKAAACDPEFPNVWASPDRVAFTSELYPRCVEAKQVGWQMAHKWGNPGTDRVPVEYWIQVQVQTRCVGASLPPHVVAAIAGRPPQVWEVAPDAALARDLCQRAQEWFERHVVADREPPAHNPDDHARLAKALFPRSASRPAEVTAEFSARVDALIEARRLADEAASLKEFREAAVKRLMGDADSARLDGEWTISWRTNTRGARPFLLKLKGE